MFPTEDSQYVFFNITAPAGTKQHAILKKIYTPDFELDKVLSGYEEIKFGTISVADEKVTIFLELTDPGVRKDA